MNTLCPCCITRNCLYLQQHIYDIKKYQNYFGHLPKTKHNKFINIPNNNVSDIEESLPQINTNRTNRSQSHGIFESPPQIIYNYNKRRQSQASVCGIPIGDNNNNISHHRKQSTLLQYDNNEMDEFGLSDNSNSDLSYDLHVAQQIIDDDAENDDTQYLSDAQSEQYDNFASIMIEREMEYLNNKSQQNAIINDKNRRQSLEIGNQIYKKDNNARGSIPNLAKKRRGSLILNAVDNIKASFKTMQNKKSKNEMKKEAQFMQSQREKCNSYYENNGSSNDDEKEYYNTKTQHVAHKRSMDRLSAVRNSLKSIIPSKFSKKVTKKVNYEPFSYATDTMIIHADKPTPTPNLMVHNYGSSTDDDDNISIATYGTAKDYLDDDFESELNALAVTMQGPSVSPNRSIQSYQEHANEMENMNGGVIVNDIKEDSDCESVSLSLESISNTDDDSASPEPPKIIKHNYNRRTRKNSVPLAQIQEIDGNSTDISEKFNHKLEYNGSMKSGDDFSCDDMLTEAML